MGAIAGAYAHCRCASICSLVWDQSPSMVSVSCLAIRHLNCGEARETLPQFRLLTGGMFGLMSAWLAFPHLDRSMREIAESLEGRAG